MTNNHYILINLVLSIFTIVFFGLFVHQAITYIKVRHASVVKNDISVEASDFDTNPTNIPSKKRIFATLVTTAVFALLWVSSIIAIYFAHAQSYVETKQLGAVHSVESFFYPSGYLAWNILTQLYRGNPLLITERAEDTFRFIFMNPALRHPMHTDHHVCWELILTLYGRMLYSFMQNASNVVTVDSAYFFSKTTQSAANLWESFLSNIFTDGISMWLVALTFFVIFALVVGTREDKTITDTRKQLILAIIVGILATVCFLTRDLLVFFMSFEATLVPLFLLVGYFGSRSEKIRAATFLFVFTLVGSAFLWAGLLYCYAVLGVTNFDELGNLLGMSNNGAADIVFWCLVLGFAFKVPVFLLHVWLTVAHVEAPTVGSVLLAGLVLKLGGYGLLRWVVLLLPVQTVGWGVYITWFCMVGYVVATLFAVQQSDLKRFVAYTSISHMNFGTAVLFNHTDLGILAYLHTMVSHGIIATALFMLVGFIYYQAGCRDSLSVNALSTTAPRFAILWFLFVIANAGIPVFSAFPGEFFGLVSLMESNGFMLFVIAFLGFFITAIYSFVVLVRVLYGTLGNTVVAYIRDINQTLNILMYVLLGLSVFLGMSPDVLFRTAFVDLTWGATNPRAAAQQNRYDETTNYMFDELDRRVGASVLYARTPSELRDFYARQIQWVHSNRDRLALHRLITDFKAFMFMGSIDAPEIIQDMIARINYVTTKHKSALLETEISMLKHFVFLLELSQNLGKSPLPVADEPGLTYGKAFTKETCCDATMYAAWYDVVYTWGPNGLVSKIKDEDFYRTILAPIILCDQGTDALMYRPDNTHTPRYEIAKNTPKDVRIDMGVLDAAYLNRLLTLPKLEGTPEFLKHNPREFSDRCIIRYRIQDSKFNSPRQPDPRLSTHRRRYG